MAILKHGGLQLWLAGPQSSAGKPMSIDAQRAPGGRHILCEDPAGNAVELFQPR